MSSPTDRTEKHDDPLAYAPKWARDPLHERRHESPNIAEGEFPQRNEQSVPKEGPISYQARAHRPLDTASLRETESAGSARSRTARRPGWPHHCGINRSGNRAVRHRQVSVRV